MRQVEVKVLDFLEGEKDSKTIELFNEELFQVLIFLLHQHLIRVRSFILRLHIFFFGVHLINGNPKCFRELSLHTLQVLYALVQGETLFADLMRSVEGDLVIHFGLSMVEPLIRLWELLLLLLNLLLSNLLLFYVFFCL